MANEWPGFFYDGFFFIDSLHDKDTVKKHRLNDWDIRSDDIVIATFPKSGTYWMINAVTKMFGDINLLLPKTKSAVRLDQLCESSEDKPGRYGDQTRALKTSLHEMPSPRLLYCHLPFQFYPTAWKEGRMKCKVIYITRNPKDVCVSFYHNMKDMKLFGMRMSWENWVPAFIEGRTWCGPWLDHVIASRRLVEQYGQQEGVLYVTYEDMKKDLKSVLARVADFLDRPMPDKEIESVVQACSFGAMAKGEDFYRRVCACSDGHAFTDGATHLRKGVVGDWKRHFTVAQNEAFDREITSKLEKFGLNLVCEM